MLSAFGRNKRVHCLIVSQLLIQLQQPNVAANATISLALINHTAM
jgi:hypothetical protein